MHVSYGLNEQTTDTRKALILYFCYSNFYNFSGTTIESSPASPVPLDDLLMYCGL